MNSQAGFSNRQIVRGTAVTSLLTLLSRILGFFRDMIVALAFGAGNLADAYFIAFRIPNLLRSFVAEGALSAAFVPIFSKALEQAPEEAARIVRAVSAFILLASSFLCVAGVIFAPELVHAMAPGLDPETRSLCILLTRIMLPYIVFVSLVAMLNGALNSLKIFGTAAWAQCLMNLVLIVGGLAAIPFSPRTGVIVLSASVLIGGLLQVLAQLPRLHRNGLSITPQLGGSWPVVREVVTLMVPALLGATVYQIGIFLNTMLASSIGPGSVSWLFYADRVAQLPIGIFTIALASVLLPALSRSAASGDRKAFSEALGNALRYTSFVTAPVAVFLAIFSEPITRIAFQRGAFDATASLNTAAAIRGYSLGIWATSCHSMLARAFIARRDTVTPTVVGMLALATNLLVSLAAIEPSVSDHSALVEVVRQGHEFVRWFLPLPILQHVGLAWGSSIGALVALCILGIRLSARVDAAVWRVFLASSAKAIIGCLGMALTAWIIQGFFSSPIVAVTSAMLLSSLSYPIFGLVLKSSELAETWALISSRFKR